jgi:flagellar motor switch protein FliN/FliY
MSGNLNMIEDISVQVKVQLGTCTMPLKEIMQLETGAVLQLKQSAKEPVCLLVNDRCIAYAEVVVVEDRFGVKITELVDNNE